MILLKTVVLLSLVAVAFGSNKTSKVFNPVQAVQNYFVVVDYYPEQTDLSANNQFKCGMNKGLPISDTKDTKIVGGIETVKNQFPWQVGLASALGGRIFCGGSIVSSKSVITAAHCVQTKPYYDGEKMPVHETLYAILAEWDESDPRSGELWNKIIDIKVHEGYQGKMKIPTYWGWGFWGRDAIESNYKNDIAVLILEIEVAFNSKIAPVCLPRPISPGIYEKYERDAAITSGWGYTKFLKYTVLSSYLSYLPYMEKKPVFADADKLQVVTLLTISNTKCFQRQFGYSFASIEDKSMICAMNTKKHICNGDSGGPLAKFEIVGNSIFYTLIGVASFGSKECKEDTVFPSVFARVTEAMDWFKQPGVIEGEQGEHPVSGTITTVVNTCATNIPRKNNKNSRSLKNSGGVTYYHFEKDKKLSRKKAQETCKSEYGGQLTSINTQDEYEWIKEQVKDLKMFGQIAIGGQWKDKSSRKFEWTDESEMDMSVLNANWFRTRNYQFPSYKNKKRINLELWYSRRAMGFANTFHKAPTMYICKVAESCTSCSSCSA